MCKLEATVLCGAVVENRCEPPPPPPRSDKGPGNIVCLSQNLLRRGRNCSRPKKISNISAEVTLFPPQTTTQTYLRRARLVLSMSSVGRRGPTVTRAFTRPVQTHATRCLLYAVSQTAISQPVCLSHYYCLCAPPCTLARCI